MRMNTQQQLLLGTKRGSKERQQCIVRQRYARGDIYKRVNQTFDQHNRERGPINTQQLEKLHTSTMMFRPSIHTHTTTFVPGFSFSFTRHNNFPV
jgi:hypothetical protein